MHNVVESFQLADTSYFSSPEPWLENMRKGNFEEAWKFSDMVIKLRLNRDYENLPRHYQCIWNGAPLAGKRVLVRCYHGLGDTIMFIRYIPILKKIAKQVIVWVQPELNGILRQMQDIDLLLPLHDGIPEAEYDTDVEIMELPHVFRTTLLSIPVNVPYLSATPLPVAENIHSLKVGLVWQAGGWEEGRNIPFTYLEPLFEIPGLTVIILQANAISAGWQEGFGIHPGEFNFSDYAGVIAGLDLLLTVDSMPAHLAGALNVPVWVMLKKKADWRWMENRNDSPWYPSMKLFRQQNEGEWEVVVEEVVHGLEKKLLMADYAVKL